MHKRTYNTIASVLSGTLILGGAVAHVTRPGQSALAAESGACITLRGIGLDADMGLELGRTFSGSVSSSYSSAFPSPTYTWKNSDTGAVIATGESLTLDPATYASLVGQHITLTATQGDSSMTTQPHEIVYLGGTYDTRDRYPNRLVAIKDGNEYFINLRNVDDISSGILDTIEYRWYAITGDGTAIPLTDRAAGRDAKQIAIPDSIEVGGTTVSLDGAQIVCNAYSNLFEYDAGVQENVYGIDCGTYSAADKLQKLDIVGADGMPVSSMEVGMSYTTSPELPEGCAYYWARESNHQRIGNKKSYTPTPGLAGDKVYVEGLEGTTAKYSSYILQSIPVTYLERSHFSKGSGDAGPVYSVATAGLEGYSGSGYTVKWYADTTEIPDKDTDQLTIAVDDSYDGKKITAVVSCDDFEPAGDGSKTLTLDFGTFHKEEVVPVPLPSIGTVSFSSPATAWHVGDVLTLDLSKLPLDQSLLDIEWNGITGAPDGNSYTITREDIGNAISVTVGSKSEWYTGTVSTQPVTPTWVSKDVFRISDKITGTGQSFTVPNAQYADAIRWKINGELVSEEGATYTVGGNFKPWEDVLSYEVESKSIEGDGETGSGIASFTIESAVETGGAIASGADMYANGNTSLTVIEARLGSTVTAKVKGLQVDATYQWLLDGEPISGATGNIRPTASDTSPLTVTEDYIGHDLTLLVTAEHYDDFTSTPVSCLPGTITTSASLSWVGDFPRVGETVIAGMHRGRNNPPYYGTTGQQYNADGTEVTSTGESNYFGPITVDAPLTNSKVLITWYDGDGNKLKEGSLARNDSSSLYLTKDLQGKRVRYILSSPGYEDFLSPLTPVILEEGKTYRAEAANSVSFDGPYVNDEGRSQVDIGTTIVAHPDLNCSNPTYQWYMDLEPIPDSDTDRLVVTADMLGHELLFEISEPGYYPFTASAGIVVDPSDKDTSDKPAGTIAIEGTYIQGNFLTAKYQVNGGKSGKVSWFANDIKVGEGDNLLLTKDMVGKVISAHLDAEGYATAIVEGSTVAAASERDYSGGSSGGSSSGSSSSGSSSTSTIGTTGTTGAGNGVIIGGGTLYDAGSSGYVYDTKSLSKTDDPGVVMMVLGGLIGGTTFTRRSKRKYRRI